MKQIGIMNCTSEQIGFFFRSQEWKLEKGPSVHMYNYSLENNYK